MFPNSSKIAKLIFKVAGIDLSRKKKVALVCSGGAVKAAAFHVGVALALEQKGFRFLGGRREEAEERPTVDPTRTVQVYVGASAGTLLTSFLAQGGKLKELLANFRDEPNASGIPGLRYWEMLFPRVRAASELLSFDNFLLQMLRSRSLQSPFSTEGIARYLRTHILKSDRFTDLEADLFLIATEVNQSRKVIFGKYKSAPAEVHQEYRNDVSISDACAASMALPPIYHPYGITLDGQRRDFFDGEIREPLNLHVARDMGCDLIICSYTHQPLRLLSNEGTLADKGVQAITLQAIYQAIEQKIQSSRESRQREKILIDRVRKFCKEKELDPKLIDELCAEIEARTSYKSNVDYLYIRPKPGDQEMFWAAHFSLKRKSSERIVRKGFLAAMAAMRQVRF